jgi:hypothetical protein
MEQIAFAYNNSDPKASTMTTNGQNSYTPQSGFTCIQYVNNVNYQNWTGENYNGIDPSNPQCTALDFGCWLGRIFGTIGDGFNAVAQGILKGLTLMFIPDPTLIKEEFDSFMTFINGKLGFLVFPITFIVDFYTGLVNNATTCPTGTFGGGGGCTLAFNFGHYMGGDFIFDFTSLQVLFGSYWTFLTMFFRASTVIGFVYAIFRKYQGVIAK